MPAFPGDEIVLNSRNWLCHADCKAAARESGGWDVTSQHHGKFKLDAARDPEAKNGYFLRFDSQQYQSLTMVAKSLHFNPSQMGMQDARAIEIIKAFTEKRLRSPREGERLVWAIGVRSRCSDCGMLIVYDEPNYNHGSQYRHALECQPENWVVTKPPKGGGTLFFPKSSFVKPLSLAVSGSGLRFTAVLYRERRTTRRIKQYYELLSDAQYLATLGKTVTISWIGEPCAVPKKEDDDRCPRCGGQAFERRVGKKGTSYVKHCESCDYEYDFETD